MRELNYDNCKWITQIPNLSGLPNLQELSFRDCDNLITVDKSVGFLDKLKILNAQGCSKLTSFPPIMLTCLENLQLSYCSSLHRFPEILGEMENIRTLFLEHTPIKELPFSIYNLIQLEMLNISECGMVQLPSSIVMMPELKEVLIFGPPKQNQGDEKMNILVSSNECLYLSYYNISNEFLPMVLTCVANVTKLDLSYQKFTFLPPCITFLQSLRKLNLHKCDYLREIRGVPPNLETLSATCCRSLKDLDLTVTDLPANIYILNRLILDQCKNLQEIKGIMPNMELLSASNCTSLTNSCRRMLLNQELHKEAGNMAFCLPGSRIPGWFEHRRNGSSISFWFRNMFPAISLCCY
ncbi:putative leucine-rich repeat domain, L domain-containing protein [Lupinus albus]|uniref:Putative leucine-rich repeat domain, L domain-containing protein n=1 Tax=Lupinus albus TaxID=3870 RepID=A0A6A4NAI0_LUPAL|nr:putative leucine-rich repeat domain, L domain-containing protein [Lupinus albus]